MSNNIFRDSLQHALTKQSISEETAKSAFFDPDDRFGPLLLDRDCAAVINRLILTSTNSIIAISVSTGAESLRPRYVFRVPNSFSVERSPWGAFRQLCNNCGITMRLGSHEARLLTRATYHRRVSTIDEILIGLSARELGMRGGTEFRHAFHFRVEMDRTLIALAFCINMTALKSRL